MANYTGFSVSRTVLMAKLYGQENKNSNSQLLAWWYEQHRRAFISLMPLKKREKTIEVLIFDCFFRLWSLQLPHPKRQNRPLKREGSCLLEVCLSPSGPICSLKEGSAMLDLACKEAKLQWLWRPRERSVCSTTWSSIPSWRSKIIKNKLKRRNMDLTQMPLASACNNNKCIPNNSESFHLEFDPLNLKLHFSGNTCTISTVHAPS